MRDSEKVARLAGRATYLRDKVARQDGSPAALNHLAAELSAIEWAVPILQDMVAVGRPTARDVHRQRYSEGLRFVATQAVEALHQAGELPRAVRRALDAHPRVAEVIDAELHRRRLGVVPRNLPAAEDTRGVG